MYNDFIENTDWSDYDKLPGKSNTKFLTNSGLIEGLK